MAAAKKPLTTPKESLPTIKIFLTQAALEVEKLPVKDGQDLLIRTTSSVIIHPFKDEMLSTGMRMEVPEGYRVVINPNFGNLRVTQLLTEEGDEVRLVVQNLSPHFVDVTPGDVVASLYLVKNQEFDLSIPEEKQQEEQEQNQENEEG